MANHSWFWTDLGRAAVCSHCALVVSASLLDGKVDKMPTCEQRHCPGALSHRLDLTSSGSACRHCGWRPS